MAKLYGQQKYDRISSKRKFLFEAMDESYLVDHKYKIPDEEFIEIIKSSYEKSLKKSSREILLGDEVKDDVKKIINDFKDSFISPASTAYDLQGKNCIAILESRFERWWIQRARMNEAWNFQYLAKDTAKATGRFLEVSDKKCDLELTIARKDLSKDPLNIYISLKNRKDTLSGSVVPREIENLENIAKNDSKNRIGPYLCVFGMSMDSGEQLIKWCKDTGQRYSVNTEVWGSNFFWRFVTGMDYVTVMRLVSRTLKDLRPQASLKAEIPNEVKRLCIDQLESLELVNAYGKFINQEKLVDFFCGEK